MPSPIIPGVLIFFSRITHGEREYLFHLRKNTKFNDGYYCVIGGHVEEGESYLQCAIRETKEETGISLRPSELRAVHLIHRRKSNEVRPDVCFVVESWTGVLKNMEPSKHGDFEWFSSKRIPKNTVDYVKNALELFEKGIFYSESGWK